MVAITSPTRNGSQEESDSLGSPEEQSVSLSFPRKSPRKQWSVQGEPRSLLKRLRSQLAEDGCPESQFAMAKALLDHKEDINYEENCHQAIFWLTQASLQGCLDATNLLQVCFENGLGICEQNYEDVKRCLEMDHQEKLALFAGKQLFMSMAEGNEFVTEKRLEAKVMEVIGHKNNLPKKVDGSCTNMRKLLEEKFGGRKLNESSLMEAALDFVRGEAPSISLEKINILELSPGLHRIFSSDLHSAVMSVIDGYFHSKLSLLCLSPFVVFLSGFLGVIFYFWNYGVLSEAFLVVLWVFSFLVMSLSATSVLVRLKNRTSFKLWSLTFQQFSQDIDVDVARSKYNNKLIFPYVTYVLSMLLYIMFLPFINANIETFVIPPLVLISISMITSLLQFNFSYNCLSSLLYIFAHSTQSQKYLKEWLIQALPSVKPYLLEESFTVYDHLRAHVDIGAILHTLWFVSLVFVSFTIGLSGILLHGLCISWFHMTLIALRQQPTLYILLSLAFWFFFLVLPQGFALLTVFIPSLFLCFFIDSAPLWVAFLVFITLSVSLGFLNRFNAKFASLLKCGLIILSLLFTFNQQTGPGARVSPLKWEQFQNICLPAKESLYIHSVRDCRPLRGTIVHWEGTIKRIDIDSVFNLPESVISFFPIIVQPRLRCLFGMPFPSCTRDIFKTDTEFQRCLILREAKGTEDCSLENWNEYIFHFVVSMETYFWKFSEHSEIVLVSGNECREAAFNLSHLDRISFIGTLDEGLGTLRPHITLNSISCLDCQVKISCSNSLSVTFDVNSFKNSSKYLFNFFFGPTFTI